MDKDEPINVTTFRDGEMNSSGLTKREYIAIKFVSALLSDTTMTGTGAVIEGIKIADQFIAELNK